MSDVHYARLLELVDGDQALADELWARFDMRGDWLLRMEKIKALLQEAEPELWDGRYVLCRNLRCEGWMGNRLHGGVHYHLAGNEDWMLPENRTASS